MARGNDSEAAQRDLVNQYGSDHASAEDLIRAHDQSFDAVRQAALNKPVDPVATKAIDIDALEPQTDGGEIRAAAVRGGVLVVVEETARGALIKWHDADYLGNRGQAKSAVSQTVGQQGGGSEQPKVTEATGAVEQAPADITSDVLQAKLAELGIDKAGATNKNAYWSLLPQDAKDALVADAAAAS